jgi:hypothetical protein
MTAFAADLYFAASALPPSPLMGIGAFLATGRHWRIVVDLTLLSLSAGLYSVPMYALVQLRAQPSHRARIIAANNILNALFMVLSAVLAGALLQAGCTIPQLVLALAVANVVVAGGMFVLVPEYLARFAAWLARVRI